MNPFQSLRNYERFVYTLQQVYPAIKRSTLVLVQRGSSIATLRGELMFDAGFGCRANQTPSLRQFNPNSRNFLFMS